MARPTLPPERKRNRRVHVHLTDAEYARLKSRADSMALPLARLIREAALAEG